MKNIYESVALGIIAVKELTDLMNDERNEEKRDTINGARYAYFYLIKQIKACKMQNFPSDRKYCNTRLEMVTYYSMKMA